MTLYRSLALAFTGYHPGERSGCIDLLTRAREAIDRRDAQRERYAIIVAARVNQSADFDRFAGISGLITGFSSLLYAVFFLLLTLRTRYSATGSRFIPPATAGSPRRLCPSRKMFLAAFSSRSRTRPQVVQT